MKRMKYGVAISVSLFMACARVESEPVVVGVPRTVDVVVHGDTRFTLEERLIIAESALSWFRFTESRARLALVWDLDETTLFDYKDRPYMVRSSPNVAYGRRCGVVGANDIHIVADGCCPDLKACVMHELGHFLKVPHVKSTGSVMSEWNPQSTFSRTDRIVCAQTGLCSALPADTTTVSHTVDRSIPNVEPNYPK